MNTTTAEMTGIWTALITPFDSSGAIDLKLWNRLIERQCAAGVDGIIVAGSTGEGQTLRFEEWKQLVREAAQHQSKIQVMASCGASSTWQVIEWGEASLECGVSHLLVSTPAYNKPPAEGLIRHFETISQKLPTASLMIYNIPGRTAVNIDPPTMARLWKLTNVKALKESSGNWNQFLDFQSQCPKAKGILCGDDPSSLAFWTHGAVGTVSVLSNLCPNYLVRLWKLFKDQNWSAARDLFFQSKELTQQLFCVSNPIPIKWAVSQVLQAEMQPRSPLLPLDSFHQKNLLDQMQVIREWEDWK